MSGHMVWAVQVCALQKGTNSLTVYTVTNYSTARLSGPTSYTLTIEVKSIFGTDWVGAFWGDLSGAKFPPDTISKFPPDQNSRTVTSLHGNETRPNFPSTQWWAIFGNSDYFCLTRLYDRLKAQDRVDQTLSHKFCYTCMLLGSLIDNTVQLPWIADSHQSLWNCQW